ncbi:MAG TPA: class I SAM-dependent methyltransferase [Opitutaceae bacterium]|nr:class I SAM-dependent methyltransferase [Opitutaceae bacterium]
MLEAKRTKLERIRSLLREELPRQETAQHFNFLNAEIAQKYGVVETDNVSAHSYDPYALNLINKQPEGLVLDCGAGKRAEYLHNVVNFEIVPYDTTDVLGVAEELPFKDEVFDGVVCLNVLEHVKNPFEAAKEIARVMKPGAELYCVVPFLQLRHGFPNHYYNMTAEGLKNLFDQNLRIDRQEIIASGLPIWSLWWVVTNWAAALPEPTRSEFMAMKVSDLMTFPVSVLNKDYVTKLSADKNFELASTTALFASKPS